MMLSQSGCIVNKDENILTALKKRNDFLEAEYSTAVRKITNLQRMLSKTNHVLGLTIDSLNEASEKIDDLEGEKLACSECLKEERENVKLLNDALLYESKKLDSAVAIIKGVADCDGCPFCIEKSLLWLKENE